MMKTDDDKLLKQFFSERKLEIEDNGFSRRVMHSLPGRKHKWSQLWSILCMIVAVTLFFVLGGLQGIVGTLREVFVSMVQQGVMNIDPRSIIIAAIVLIALAIRKAWSMA